MSESRFVFVGKALWIDFVNTEVISGGRRVDLLGSFQGLEEWLVAAGALDRPGWGAGGHAFEAAVALRSNLRELAERLAAGTAIDDASLAAINELLRRRIEYTRIERSGDGFVEVATREYAEPTDLLVPVAQSAAELLAHGDPSLVKKCRNPDCILYFYDTTKNHGRSWCSMGACGNRSKVAAHYKRKRSARP